MSEAGVLAARAAFSESDGALWERDDDVAAVDGLLTRAEAGASGALFIVGDAGLGKSALLAKAQRGRSTCWPIPGWTLRWRVT